MPRSQQPPPPAASILSRPASSLAAAAAVANATSATPLREQSVFRRVSQLEAGSPPNNLPASPAASLPSNSGPVASQQPASPSPAPFAQGKAKNKVTDNKSKPAGSSQQGKPRFQWTRGSNVVDGLHPEGHLANWMGIYENWKVYSTLIAGKRPQFCEEHVIPYFTEVGISCKGLSPSAIVGRIFRDWEGVTEEDIAKGIDTWDKKLRSVCPYYHVLKATLGITNADLTDGNRLHDLFDNSLYPCPATIADKEAEELGESDFFMTTDCRMSEDISTADEGGIVWKIKLAKELKGKSKSRRNEAFHKVQDSIMQMMLEVNANDQKGRMELAAFRAEAAATARAEEREAREARWKLEDERDGLMREMEMKRMQAESARYSAEAALRNAGAKKVAEEHQICMAKRKREEEEAEEERNIKRTTAIQARTMWLVEFAKKRCCRGGKASVLGNYRKRKIFLAYL
ncbi:hypothetical protein I308_100595 [Cryptococcus tetragattii IND107]|uniref:Uncharacterized protein n=1 Tax=Cryptococcus tetragattii IND107 TaxID=1296105 RepID=A0ABR3C584_9TREE